MESPPPTPTSPGGSPFRTRTRSSGEGLVVSLAGEFDLSAVDAYHEAFAAALASGPGPVTLDLGKLGFIDSSGLRCLVESLSRCQEEGRTLSICEPAPQVQRLLELTGLSERLPRVPCPVDLAPEPAT